MTPSLLLRSPMTAVAAAAVLLAAAPIDGHAQSWRTQAAWVAGQVGGATVGAEFREGLGGEPELPLPGRAGQGPIEVSSQSWYLSLMAAGGLNFIAPGDEGDELEPLVYTHAGLLYRTKSKLIGYAGVVAAAYFPVGAVGPAALVEAADVVDLQVGALHADGAWHGHAALTVSLRFLVDIFGG